MSVIKGAYYLSSDATNFSASMVDTTHFTHIYYSFITPDRNTYTINLSDSERDRLKSFANTLHAAKPLIKVILSIAGDKQVLANMASTAANRSLFIKSCTQTARDCGFDGMDFDWQFPERTAQMSSFETLLQEWRVEIENEFRTQEGKFPVMYQLTLSAAVYYTVELQGPPRKYPVASIGKNLDWVHVRTYNYGSSDTSVTQTHAKLFNPDNESLSTSHGLNNWIKAGVPKAKVVMGLPLFGRTWKLTNQYGDTGIGAPADGVGPGANGVMTYSEIKKFNDKDEATVIYDGKTVSAYSVANENWIGFDNRDSIEKKISYARDNLGVGGYFFWAVNGDYNSELARTASEAW